MLNQIYKQIFVINYHQFYQMFFSWFFTILIFARITILYKRSFLSKLFKTQSRMDNNNKVSKYKQEKANRRASKKNGIKMFCKLIPKPL